MSPDDVVHALEGVPDPEMPPVSVVELGMVEHVRVDGDRVEIDLVPTFSGCPALVMIEQDVVRAVEALTGVQEVTVRFRNDIVWEPERISESGRDKLREFGIAPPGSGQPRRLDGVTLLGINGLRCPLCGSRNTVADSVFGPTPCRSTHYCTECSNPFEAMKP